MSNAAVQTEGEGQVLTITQQLVPQVRSCRRGETHLVRTRRDQTGPDRTGKERKGKETKNMKKTGEIKDSKKEIKRKKEQIIGGRISRQGLFSPGAYR